MYIYIYIIPTNGKIKIYFANIDLAMVVVMVVAMVVAMVIAMVIVTGVVIYIAIIKYQTFSNNTDEKNI